MTTAQRLIHQPTAFSLSNTKTRRPRVEDRKHLEFIRSLRCCICGTHKQVEAAHVRIASLAHGKRECGKAEKPDDKWTTPLCASHHREQHDIGEHDFWKRYGLDPFLISLSLWGATGRGEEAEEIVRQAIGRVSIRD